LQLVHSKRNPRVRAAVWALPATEREREREINKLKQLAACVLNEQLVAGMLIVT
jgi:hypothetical protein